MIDYGKEIDGSLSSVTDSVHEKIKEVAAQFHVRNGVEHLDGSLGEIEITHEQLKQCLAYMFRSGMRIRDRREGVNENF